MANAAKEIDGTISDGHASTSAERTRSYSVLRLTAFVLVTTLISLEFALQIVDPLGLHYFDDTNDFAAQIRSIPGGYSIPPGNYRFWGWSMLIGADGTRAVPSVGTGQRVLFFGDSVTMSWGVNDQDTWVNLVAGELNLNASNYGRLGYSADAVRRLLESEAGDSCAVFLSVSNDADFVMTPRPVRPPWRPMLLRYIHVFTFGSPDVERPNDAAAYDAAMRAIAARPNTLVLALGESYGAQTAVYGAITIPSYTERLSLADAHANQDGNRQLAGSIAPIVRQWLTSRDCHS